ncbi:hypothetical protein Taro_052586, partial [Colocasia esculenta]|nr:hypothetical protein [Colocasia esculenta]
SFSLTLFWTFPGVESIWDQVVDHILELINNSNHQFRQMGLDALDRSISSVLGSDKFHEVALHHCQLNGANVKGTDAVLSSFECAIISPLRILYKSSQNLDVRTGSVAHESERDLIPLGFQSIRVIMNDELSTIPIQSLDVCIDVTGAYGEQKTDLNISLTAVGLLWTTTDFIAKGLVGELANSKLAGFFIDVESNAMEKIDHQSNQDGSTIHPTSETHSKSPLLNTVDRDKLMFSVFSILRKLGGDERPEVRNAAIRTLFQTLGSHGQKLSRSMWEDCLWNYVFPILDSVDHLASTSSRDEWQGKELGTRGGKAVHMLIHHSRNTAQKQWDETLVLVLGGISRLLRSFFPFLQSLDNFSVGWERLLHFIRDSISNGSKEVAFAAINCLQTTVTSNCPKGNLSMSYLKSILDVYELVLRRSPSYSSGAANKVKQEILHGLGELFVQAKVMFDNEMYSQILLILHLAIRHSIATTDSYEIEFGVVQSMHRTIFEIVRLLRPTENLSAMWPELLRQLLCYLPVSESPLHEKRDQMHRTDKFCHDNENAKVAYHRSYKEYESCGHVEAQKNLISDASSHSELISCKNELGDFGNSSSGVSGDATVCTSSYIFGEKLIPVIIELFLAAPAAEKENVFPEIIRSLGRCMATRRDNPTSTLWRLAVEGFNSILVDDVTRLGVEHRTPQTVHRFTRTRLWKEVADVYDIFLVGSCGRAISSDALSAEILHADESLEMAVLNVLGDKILKAQLDAPYDSLQRLVSALDHCASRTGSLPIETVSLLPAHCSSFSLTCLQKLFSLASYNSTDVWHSTRSEVSKISITFLMSRCSCILNQFLMDENDLGDCSLPTLRIEELIYVLQELARLVIHPEAASVLHMDQYLKEALMRKRDVGVQAHLLVLFPSFCELVVSREATVRELVRVLLRLVASELGLLNLVACLLVIRQERR